MKIGATLLPGQKGTRQLVKVYGDQLVCVRYRDDKARQKRLKTVRENGTCPQNPVSPEPRPVLGVILDATMLRSAR